MTATITTTGGTQYTVTLDKGSYYKIELMKEEYVLLSFNHPDLIPMGVGTTAAAGGYSGVLTEDYAPTYNQARGCYSYSVQFKATYWAKNNTLVKRVENGKTLTIFDITDHPLNILNIICQCAGWTASTSNMDEDALKAWVTVSFNGTYCVDALNALVQAMDENGYYEWWFSGSTCYIGKLGSSGSGVALTEENIEGISASRSTARKVTKVYAMGGTRNMSPRIGLPSPTISATKSIYYKDPIYGYDPNHIITTDMFPSSMKTYQKVPCDGYCRVQYSGKVGENTRNFPQYSTRIPDVNGFSKVRFVANSEYYEFIVDSPFDESFSLKVELYAGCHDNDSGIRAIKKIGESANVTIEKGIAKPNIKVSEKETTINIDEGEYPALVVKFISDLEYISDLDYADITFSWYKGFNVYSLNNVKVVCNNGATLNPLMIDITKNIKESCIFDKQFINTTDQLGIPRSKVPVSWFYESENYSSSITIGAEQRLTSIAGSGDVEAQVIFDEIYPKIGGTIKEAGEFKTVEEKDTNGELTGRNLIYYSFKTDLFSGLDSSYYVEDKCKIAFGLGSKLGGMEFDIAIVGQSDGSAEIAIIPNENYSQLIPNSVLHPEAGDTFSLFGLNAAIYDDGTAAQVAQAQLDAAAVKYLLMCNTDDGVYNCNIKPTQAGAIINGGLSFGAAASLSFVGASLSSTRVIGFKKYLDLPEAGLEVMVGNSTPYRKIDYLEKKVTIG